MDEMFAKKIFEQKYRNAFFHCISCCVCVHLIKTVGKWEKQKQGSAKVIYQT